MKKSSPSLRRKNDNSRRDLRSLKDWRRWLKRKRQLMVILPTRHGHTREHLLWTLSVWRRRSRARRASIKWSTPTTSEWRRAKRSWNIRTGLRNSSRIAQSIWRQGLIRNQCTKTLINWRISCSVSNKKRMLATIRHRRSYWEVLKGSMRSSIKSISNAPSMKERNGVKLSALTTLQTVAKLRHPEWPMTPIR